MSTPTRVRVDTYDYLTKPISDDFIVFLRIYQYDDGYEEYEVGMRNTITNKEDHVQFHGYDLASAKGDFKSRSSSDIANINS